MTNAMTCELFNDSLMSYLEREVDETTAATMERHALTCDECGALLADLRKLRVDAANLPLLQPSRDLWSGIAARIEAPVLDIGTARQAPTTAVGRPRRWLRVSLAAAALVAAAGLGYVAAASRASVAPTTVAEVPADSMVAGVGVVSEAAPVAPASAPRVAENRVPARVESPAPAPAAPTSEVQVVVASLTADYDREVTRLRTLIEQRRNQLDPVTVGVIEKNLQVIDMAIEDCKKAIARDPASRFLLESLNQSLRSKVELMRTAALLPSRT